MATYSIILAGGSHGRRSLVGYSPWGPRTQTQLSNWTTAEPRAVTPAFVYLGLDGAIVICVGKGAVEEEGVLRIRTGAESMRESERERRGRGKGVPSPGLG